MLLIRKSRRTLLLQAATLPLVTFFMPSFAESEKSAESADAIALTELNQNYLVSYRTGDVQWFDRNLTEDFREAAPDGTLLNKAEFLRKIGLRVGGDAQGVQAVELEIRLFGDLAVVHAMPETISSDGISIRGGRYTDVYYRDSGRWLCVSAHLGGS